MGALFSSTPEPAEPIFSPYASRAVYTAPPTSRNNHVPLLRSPTFNNSYTEIYTDSRSYRAAAATTTYPRHSAVDHDNDNFLTGRAYYNPPRHVQSNYRLSSPTNNNVYAPGRQKQSPKRVIIDTHKYDDLLSLSSSIDYCVPAPYATILLDSWDSEYQSINRLVKNKRKIKVISIEKIENPFLEASYQLKKEQKIGEFGDVEELLMFHGTKSSNVDGICKLNFNWRLSGANIGHRFGKGISFSYNATYASNYSDKRRPEKVLIVAKLLVARSCLGNQFMELPPDGYDTTRKDDGIVTVKYEDNEFFPAYKVTYFLNNN